MKKIFYTSILFFAVGCNSGGNGNNSSYRGDTNSVKGNSAGSNIIEMDTLHMDTSGNSASADTTRH